MLAVEEDEKEEEEDFGLRLRRAVLYRRFQSAGVRPGSSSEPSACSRAGGAQAQTLSAHFLTALALFPQSL